MGAIIELIERNGFHIAGMRKMQLSRAEAEAFYAAHKARSFFGELVDYMVSGPVVVLSLSKESAIQEWRDLMGATDPAKAAPAQSDACLGPALAAMQPTAQIARKLQKLK